MCVIKFYMHYILNYNFDQIFLELYQKVSDGNILSWLSVFSVIYFTLMFIVEDLHVLHAELVGKPF